MIQEELVSLMVNGSNMLGVSINDSQAFQFLEYLFLVKEWNEKINLTAITDEKEFIIKHFLDSLSGAGLIEGRGKLVDIGSGAGFPGLALKIVYPKLDVCLIESVGKKAEFLEEAKRSLSLEDVQVVHGRAEDFGQHPAFREAFDFAVSRAVSDLAVIAEYCLPLVKKGGIFVAYKGPAVDEEVSRSFSAISTLGGTVDSIKNLSLPFSGDERTLISIKKTAACPEKFPRRAGIPVKRPLV